MAEICEKSFPFDSEEISGEFDREYVADDFARYFRAFISSGTFMRSPTNLQVFANTTTIQNLEMIPLSELPNAWDQSVLIDTPPQNL